MSVKGERYHSSNSVLESLLGRLSVSEDLSIRWSNRFETELTCAVTDEIAKAFDKHAVALTAAAKASDRYAERLVWATAALVLTTLGLIGATVWAALRA